MTCYYYKAIDGLGQIARGSRIADSPDNLRQQLSRGGLYLIRSWRCLPAFGQNIQRRDILLFFLMLEQLIRSGVPLLDALTSLRDTHSGPIRLTLAILLGDIESGKPFSQALAAQSTTFGPLCIHLIAAGEQSGRLDMALHQLTEALKWHDETMAQTRNLLLYPMLAGGLILAVTLFLLLYLIPQLTSIMQSLGQPVPLQLRISLALGSVLRQGWPLFALLPVGIWFVRGQIARSPQWLLRADTVKLRLWLIGPLQHKLILARLANTLSMLYAAGLPLLESLKLCRNLTGNRAIADALDQAHLAIQEGASLTRSFNRSALFPPLVLQMIKVGEESGRLDDALCSVSDFYGREVGEALRRLQTLIEPALTLLLGLILGSLMLSVLLPIYDIVARTQTT